MNIHIRSLNFSDILSLQNKNTLYVMDYRAIWESMDYEIPTMWKYENIFPRIAPGCLHSVNEDFLKINYHKDFLPLVIKKTPSPKESVASRLENISLPWNIQSIYTAIPHPQLDILCVKRNLKINYSYEDFQKLNNKIAQKKLIKDFTPERGILKWDQKFPDNTFIKRDFWSGWFTVFYSDQTTSEDIDLYTQYKWYREKNIKWKSMSLQIFKENNNFTIFGMCEQIIEWSYFIWWKLLSLDNISSIIYNFINSILSDLWPLLQYYEWFFWIDFILEKETNRPFFLEANIRVTAMTIPVLLNNYYDWSKKIFLEDIPIKDASNNRDIILSIDSNKSNVDVLS